MQHTLGRFCVEKLAEGDDLEDLMRWEDVVKLYLKESWCDGCDGVQWIGLGQQCQAAVSMVIELKVS